jgi:hypothetical protein
VLPPGLHFVPFMFLMVHLYGAERRGPRASCERNEEPAAWNGLLGRWLTSPRGSIQPHSSA